MNDSPGSGGDAGDQRPFLAMIQNMLLTISADMKAELSSVKSDLTRVMSDVQELTKKVAVGPEEGESPGIKGEEDGRESSQEFQANISVVVPYNYLFSPAVSDLLRMFQVPDSVKIGEKLKLVPTHTQYTSHTYCTIVITNYGMIFLYFCVLQFCYSVSCVVVAL